MRKLATFVGGFTAAVALLIYFQNGANLCLAAAAACVTVPLFFLPGKFLRRLAVFFLGLTVGFSWCTVFTSVLLRPADSLCGESTAFTARAADYSSRGKYGSHVTVDIVLDGRDVRAALSYTEDLAIEPGDILTGTATFQRTAMNVAAGEDLYDISRGVYLSGEADSALAVTKDGAPSLRTWLLRLSNRLQENLYAVFPADSAGFFTALTTGDRSGMSYAFRNRLAVVGLYHAVSLSGMHISILMSTLLFFCMGRRKLAASVGIPAIILFCLLSGGSPATIRAVCMQIILLLGLFLNREYDTYTALATAMLLLLLENPWSFAHWGLQLSFASTAGILILMPCMRRRLPKNRILRGILTPMCVTISATVFSAPLMSIYFGMNSIVAPITNILALWSVTASFVGGIVISLLGFLPLPIAQFLAKIFNLLYCWLQLVTNTFSNLPVAAAYSETPLLLVWSYVVYALLTLCLICRPKWWLPVSAAAVTLAIALLLSPELPDGMTVLDVGQGQCILLHNGSDSVLVDCGASGDATGEDAARFLISHGIDSLDAVVITHFDADHCDGVTQLLDRIPVDILYIPGDTEVTELQTSILSSAGDTPVIPVDVATHHSLGQGVMTLCPAISGTTENDMGLSVLATVGECDILITGDLSAKAEARLTAHYDFPDLEVLVAGHHGSKSSTGNALLDALRPETVLISAGENQYDLPSEETLRRIAHTGAKVYCTKENGNLTIRW